MTDCLCCNRPAEDEYHYYETICPYGETVTVEVVWKLCEKCCEFAVDVVESVSNLEEEIERWRQEKSQP